MAPGVSDWIILTAIAPTYVYRLRVAARHPDLMMDDLNDRVLRLPTVAEIFPAGTHYLLPILVLVGTA